MSEDRTVAAALLDAMAAHGIDTCFGIPGVHNLAMWNALAPGRPRIIGVRHEQAAGYACDGMYRATGRAGAALLTSGPAAANILAAFGEAFTAYSPMLVIASDVSTDLRHHGVTRGILHEMRDQAAMFAAFGAWARTATSPQDAVEGIGEALAVALGSPGAPAYLGVASDVLEMPWDGPVPRPSTRAAQPVRATSIDALAALVRDSGRIVVWLGGGVTASGTEDQVRALVERLGAVAVTSFAGRGLLACSPHLVDAPVHEPEVSHLIADADLLLVLGSDVDAMNTRNWRMPLPPKIAAVSLGNQVAHTFDWDLLVGADLRDVLPALAGRLAGDPVRAPWLPGAAQVRDTVLARLRTDPRLAAALDLVTAVETAWPQEAAVVGDMAVAGFWATLYARQDRPRRAHYPVGWGTLGYGLPAALGPAARGIPTLCVAGDGGPMFALGELATIAQESLPVTLLVVDDGGYGMLRFDQQVFGHPERGVDLLTPDWVALAASFGIGAAEVGSGADLPAAFAQAYDANVRGEPRLLVWRETLYPPRTTSPRWFES